MSKSDATNLDLWLKVEKTDLAQTKAITGKPYKGTSPKPYYLIRKATETFGPCGIGWGFEIIEEKLLDGALLAPSFYERIHMARVRVWYEWNGKRGTIEHVGQTAFSGKRRDGTPFTDEDAPKKSVTDALVKALSMIGFAGDIFMGRYDDSKYVQELRDEASGHSVEPIVVPEAGPHQDAALRTNDRDRPHQDAAQRVIDDILTADTLADLDRVSKHYAGLYRNLSPELQEKVTRTATARRAVIGKAAA